MKRVLFIGAHFDDIEVGVGGTLIKHVDKGDDVYIAILESDEFRTGDIEIRTKEQLNSMKFLGIDKSKLRLFNSFDDESNIIGQLDIILPGVVYTIWEKDTHQAHRRASFIGQSVGRKKNTTTIFYCPGSSYEFYPNMYSIIDFGRKTQLINCFTTQLKCGALKMNVRKKMEAYWASMVSDLDDCYAEGLIVRKMIYKV